MLKMLHTNSLRFHQPHVEEGHPYIRHSFVQMLYPDVAVDMEKLMQSESNMIYKRFGSGSDFDASEQIFQNNYLINFTNFLRNMFNIFVVGKCVI